jgi:hypothetical protein
MFAITTIDDPLMESLVKNGRPIDEWLFTHNLSRMEFFIKPCKKIID